MKIITVLGARPQFIKAGSVSREILRQQESKESIQEIIIHTGQHYDANMSEIFFEEMQISKPKYHLGIGGKDHSSMTGQMIAGIGEVLENEKPDVVLVYGDTNSTLAGAISASKLNIRIAHIEAGLRSFNMQMPEEVNRILTDRVSNLLFCPTEKAIENLEKEGINNWKTGAKVFLSGDVMQDGANFYSNLSKKPPDLLLENEYILCTIHRAENTDNPRRLDGIISALNHIAKTKQVVLPLHPRTKKILSTTSFDTSNLTIIDPVGYLNMVWLIDNSSLIMTDSGGLQKEAYFFSKQCITLRDETEWVELVNCGANILVGSNKNKILDAYKNNSSFESEKFNLNFYGNGEASKKIVREHKNL